MNETGEKIGCKVRVLQEGKLTPGFDGIAHIKRAKYDERFSVCFGSVEVVCTPDAGPAHFI
ncbi:unnamed protein product [Gemmata massiliana]|uniref:Uncharacterized protein n=1 Tax=Gemmata massiliana TaxID=1210884 RepID=A0A6P2DKX5_9BACT|nr:unnamed protein product [Gemmata massiliana]